MEWFENLRQDLAKACGYERRGRPLRRLVLALAEPGIQAVIVYRFGRWALKYPLLSLIYYPLHFAIHVLWGIELPRHAEIGPGLYIGHFGGHRLK